MLKIILSLLLLVIPLSQVMAAPFCIGSQTMPPQCVYFDVKECQIAASKISAQCKINDEEVTLEPGIGKYCLVRSYGSPACIYHDIAVCNKDAVKVDGICQDNRPTEDFSEDTNPYSAYPEEALLQENKKKSTTPFTNEDIYIPSSSETIELEIDPNVTLDELPASEQ